MPDSDKKSQSDTGSETKSLENGGHTEARAEGKSNTTEPSAGTTSHVQQNRGSKQTSKRIQARENPYNKVQVLLLNYEYTDVSHIRRDTTTVHETFNALGYRTIPCIMDNRKPTRELDRKLDEALKKANNQSLLIIYYNGHGGFRRHNEQYELSLSSHNTPDELKLYRSAECPDDAAKPPELNLTVKHGVAPKATILWKHIRDKLKDLKCDVLIILDCCNAGLAAVDSEDVDSEVETGEQLDLQNEQQGPKAAKGKTGIRKQRHNAIRITRSRRGSRRRPRPEPEPEPEREQEQERERELESELESKSESEPGWVPAPKQEPQPRKELIGACAWRIKTASHMSPAMCDVLKKLRGPGDSISASNLAGRMNNRLIRRFDGQGEPRQAVHYVLRYSGHENDSQSDEPMAGKIVLPWLEKQDPEDKSPSRKSLVSKKRPSSDDESTPEKKMASKPKKGAKRGRKRSHERGPSSKNV